MKKQVLIDLRAKRELGKFPKKVQLKFEAYFGVLEEMGTLSLPEGKKISKNIFEIRFILDGANRGLYAYVDVDQIIILLVFRKKSQKTPLQYIDTAEKRLRRYE